MASHAAPALIPLKHISRSMLILRDQRVTVDSNLAAIYGVTTGRTNEAVKRNAERFAEDFMFRLPAGEHPCCYRNLAISTAARVGRRELPWTFAEHRAIQPANDLNPRSPSPWASTPCAPS